MRPKKTGVVYVFWVPWGLGGRKESHGGGGGTHTYVQIVLAGLWIICLQKGSLLKNSAVKKKLGNCGAVKTGARQISNHGEGGQDRKVPETIGTEMDIYPDLSTYVRAIKAGKH